MSSENETATGETPDPNVEPKWKACRRLEKQGDIKKFRERVAHFRSKKGGSLGRDDAFYTALKEFPPPSDNDGLDDV